MNILSLITFLPLVGALVVLALPQGEATGHPDRGARCPPASPWS